MCRICLTLGNTWIWYLQDLLGAPLAFMQSPHTQPPTPILDAFPVSHSDPRCPEAHPGSALAVPTQGFTSTWLPQALPCPQPPPPQQFHFSPVCASGGKDWVENLIEHCGFTCFRKMDLYSVLQVSVSTVILRGTYVSNSKQLNFEWIWWPNPFITWKLHWSKFWWVESSWTLETYSPEFEFWLCLWCDFGEIT